MKYKLTFLLLGVLLAFSSCKQTKEIHLSPNGNDNGSGTVSEPFMSLERARDEIRILVTAMNKGVVKVILHEGVYKITKPLIFTQEDAFNENIKVLWKAADGEKPVISGAVNVMVPDALENNICSISYPESEKLFDIYVNGERAIRARTPDSDFFRFVNVTEEVLVRGEGRAPEKAIQEIVLPEDALLDLSDLSDEELKSVRFHAFFKWDNTIRHISGRGKDSASYLTTGAGMKPWNSMMSGTRFFIENYGAALNSPGEWYARNGDLMYIPKEGVNGIDLNVRIPVSEKLLVIEGEGDKKIRNIIFEGISFRYSNYKLTESGFEPAQAASTIDAAIMIDHAEEIEFRNCEIAHTGQYGIWFRKGTRNCRMMHCYLYDLGAGGVRIGETLIPEDKNDVTGNILVENCIIQHGGYNFPSAVGVWIGQSGNNDIIRNDIADFRYTGVSVGWIWGYAYSPAKNNKIKYNHIHHIGWALLSDMAGVYTLGSSKGTEVSNNLIHDIHAYTYGGWGLYTDEGSSYISMENNLVFNTKTGGFHQHYGKENKISNNILAFADIYQVQATRVEDHLSFSFTNNIIVGNKGVLLAGPWKMIRVEVDSNCYWYTDGINFDFIGSTFREWQNETGHDQNSIIADPGEINLSEQTYYLNNGIADKTGFKLFDPKEAGVYGDSDWIREARLPDKIVTAFEEAVRLNKERSIDKR